MKKVQYNRDRQKRQSAELKGEKYSGQRWPEKPTAKLSWYLQEQLRLSQKSDCTPAETEWLKQSNVRVRELRHEVSVA